MFRKLRYYMAGSSFQDSGTRDLILSWLNIVSLEVNLTVVCITNDAQMILPCICYSTYMTYLLQPKACLKLWVRKIDWKLNLIWRIWVVQRKFGHGDLYWQTSRILVFFLNEYIEKVLDTIWYAIFQTGKYSTCNLFYTFSS